MSFTKSLPKWMFTSHTLKNPSARVCVVCVISSCLLEYPFITSVVCLLLCIWQVHWCIAVTRHPKFTRHFFLCRKIIELRGLVSLPICCSPFLVKLLNWSIKLKLLSHSFYCQATRHRSLR